MVKKFLEDNFVFDKSSPSDWIMLIIGFIMVIGLGIGICLLTGAIHIK